MIGTLLDAKGQIDAQALGSFRSLGRQGKQGRDGSCLEQEDLTGSIDGPFEILWVLIQRFNSRPKRRQCLDLLIRKAGKSGRGACFDLAGPSSGCGLDQYLLVAGEDEHKSVGHPGIYRRGTMQEEFILYR